MDVCASMKLVSLLSLCVGAGAGAFVRSTEHFLVFIVSCAYFNEFYDSLYY